MITRHNGDFLTFDQVILNDSIDLLLTDPPYNISDGGAKPVWVDKVTGKDKNSIHNQKFSESFDQDWDSVTHDEFLIQLDTWAKFWNLKLRKGGSFVIFISDKYLSYLWKSLSDAGLEPKRAWTWKKPAAVPFNRKVNPVSACEYAVWGVKPGGKRTFNSNAKKGSIIERYAAADKISSIVYKIAKTSTTTNLDEIFAAAKKEAQLMIDNRKIVGDVVECVIPNTITYSGGAGKNKIHPTEKPVEILEYFIALLTNVNDVVLDTFAGSGSTGVAANNTCRDCILIERDSKMFAAMSKRIQGLAPAQPVNQIAETEFSTLFD